jgi:Restriction endonuclease
MNRAQMTLRPSDLFMSFRHVPAIVQPDGSKRFRVGPPGSEPTLARDALDSAGLTSPWLMSFVASSDVGTYVLHVPTSYRTLKEDEADRLGSARQAAIRSMRRLVRFSAGAMTSEDNAADENDTEAGASLVLLRGRAPTRIEPYESFGLDLRTGETIDVEVDDRVDFSRRMWAVIEVTAIAQTYDVHSESLPFFFNYRLVHAVADVGPLRVSSCHPSLSKSVCFDTVCRHLLSVLDLTHEPLPDPNAALQFLLDAHQRGLPPDVVPSEHTSHEAKRTFSERLLGAMDGNRRMQQSSRQQPPRRLIKTSSDAEHYAAEYMRYLGFADAVTTPSGSDGGIDVHSTEAVAQVKMEGVPTGRPIVQGISGIAALDERRALVFSLAGYTSQAVEWADRAGVACFEFAVDGSVEAASQAARALGR